MILKMHEIISGVFTIRIVLINGHPDAKSFSSGLTNSYRRGAEMSDAKVPDPARLRLRARLRTRRLHGLLS